jgi:hypothetical protein
VIGAGCKAIRISVVDERAPWVNEQGIERHYLVAVRVVLGYTRRWIRHLEKVP